MASTPSITVVIPVLNESACIGDVVRFVRQDLRVGEVIVVDDGSIDATAELAQKAGARVMTSTLLGKGASMADGLRIARNPLILYLDGDLRELDPSLVRVMTDPLIEDRADFVKARFRRPAGRVTALTARPLLRTFFPELASFEQPLGGIVAARASLLRKLAFENDYGVDVGLLIDAWQAGARLAEADIGRLDHDSKPLDLLGDMATQVVRAILRRAERMGRFQEAHMREVQELERRMHVTLEALLRRIGPSASFALFDMDGVLVDDRFVTALAARTGNSLELHGLLDAPDLDAETRTRSIAAVFSGVPHSIFEDVALSLPLMPGAAETVIAMRKAGYCVGILTDSYFTASEIVARRVFADFSIGHVMKFRDGVASGELIIPPAFLHEQGCREHRVCKVNVLKHLFENTDCLPGDVIAVGDSANDICLLRAAGKSFAFHPKSGKVREAAQHVIHGRLRRVADIALGRRAPFAALHEHLVTPLLRS